VAPLFFLFRFKKTVDPDKHGQGFVGGPSQECGIAVLDAADQVIFAVGGDTLCQPFGESINQDFAAFLFGKSQRVAEAGGHDPGGQLFGKPGDIILFCFDGAIVCGKAVGPMGPALFNGLF
jgi:hypothetical protein